LDWHWVRVEHFRILRIVLQHVPKIRFLGNYERKNTATVWHASCDDVAVLEWPFGLQ
jgi:hypothetical protein